MTTDQSVILKAREQIEAWLKDDGFSWRPRRKEWVKKNTRLWFGHCSRTLVKNSFDFVIPVETVTRELLSYLLSRPENPNGKSQECK